MSKEIPLSLQSIQGELDRILEANDLDPNLSDTDIEDIVSNLQSDIALSMRKSLERQRKTIVSALDKDRKGFERRNVRRWKPALDHLEAFIIGASEIGEAHDSELRPSAVETNNYTFEAISHLFPKAILVSREILSLLRAGYPDGALARWRALHEISVVTAFISGSDNEIAERYLSSFYFASTKAARQLSEYSDRANIEAFTEDYLKEMDEFCKGISAKLGPDLQFDYGWASPKIGKKNPNLFDLEKMLKLDHWRPRYRWASQHTHAGHRPPDRLLGVSEAAGQVFLIGPSNSGFVDPLQMTEMSLVHCLISFLFLEINIDRVIVAKIFMEWSQEIGPLALEREAFTRKRNSGFVAQFVRRFRTLGSKL